MVLATALFVHLVCCYWRLPATKTKSDFRQQLTNHCWVTQAAKQPLNCMQQHRCNDALFVCIRKFGWMRLPQSTPNMNGRKNVNAKWNTENKKVSWVGETQQNPTTAPHAAWQVVWGCGSHVALFPSIASKELNEWVGCGCWRFLFSNKKYESSLYYLFVFFFVLLWFSIANLRCMRTFGLIRSSLRDFSCKILFSYFWLLSLVLLFFPGRTL